MKGYEELKAEKPDAMRPVFVIGSEVPIPGGATEAEDTLAVTKPEAFRDTVSTYQRVWTEEGVGEGMKDVIAVVVQPVWSLAMSRCSTTTPLLPLTCAPL